MGHLCLYYGIVIVSGHKKFHIGFTEWATATVISCEHFSSSSHW